MHKIIILCMLCMLCFFGACTSSTRVLLTDQFPTKPTRVQDVMVYLSSPPLKAKPLAVLSVVRQGENSVWAVEALKSEAAEIGADAIANLEISYSTGMIPELKVTGLAVKYGL